jgi:immune inhibitor A
MKKMGHSVLWCALAASGLLLTASAAVAAPSNAKAISPSPALVQALQARGVIPAGATEAEALGILQTYLQTKLGHGEDRENPLAAAGLREGEKTGKPKSNHGRVMRPNNKRFDNVVTLLVEFAGTDNGVKVGPLHNQIPQPPQWDNTTFWVQDFNTGHYQHMLFDMNPSARSMSTFYLEQSGGTYTVDGQVYGWVAVPHSEWWYGADSADGGIDNGNGPVWRVVRDAVAQACQVPWKQFDAEDPNDLDGDGNFLEPDGYVDHIQLVHAGMGQEAGGGAEGDDAIWAHSWWAAYGTHGPGYGGVPTCDPDVWVGPYTINPEDGTIGVFTHEFGHDLGLPDLYDTQYTGEASTGFWTLMSSGSWLGCPGEALGTCPAAMGAWEKWVLGWLEPTVVVPGETMSNVVLKKSTAAGTKGKVIQVQLPAYTYETYVNEPYSGDWEWYSGQGDMLNQTLTREVELPAGAALSFWTWFDIEQDWDYGFVEVSADGGATWATVPGNLTTNHDPSGNNSEGNGITGTTGWVQGHFDLGAWGGATVLLRFRYETDQAVQGLGWAIDDITVGSLFDDVESGNLGWTTQGWAPFEGAATLSANHYYMVEWRTPAGFDVSMSNLYNFVGSGYTEFFSAQPGMLVWYRNTRYQDNWVGLHPWEGGWTVVDAHPDLVLADDLTWLSNAIFTPDPNLGFPYSTRIQIADATFGLQSTPAQPVSNMYGLYTSSGLPELPAVPTFDDSRSYVDARWAPWFYAPGYGGYIRNAISSAATPTYGLRMTVVDELPGAGRVSVDFSGYSPN